MLLNRVIKYSVLLTIMALSQLSLSAQHAGQSPISLHHQWRFESERVYLHLHWNAEDGADISFVVRDSATKRIVLNWHQHVPDKYYKSKKPIFATFKSRDTILDLNQKITTLNVEINNKGDLYYDTWHLTDPAIMYLNKNQNVIYPKILLVEDNPTDLYLDITSKDSGAYSIQLNNMNTGVKYHEQTDSNSSLIKINAANLPDGNYELKVGSSRDHFRIINPSFKATKATIIVDWENIDTTKNIFADMSVSKLTKAAQLTMLRMTEKERLAFRTHVVEKDYPKLSSELMIYWATQYGNQWPQAWEDYVTEVNEIHRMYKVETRSGVETAMGKHRLRYDEPDETLEASNAPGTYPYILWIYYPTETEKQKTFLFIKPMMRKEYILVYDSEEPTGYVWEQMLFTDPNDVTNEGTDIYIKMRQATQQ